MARRQPDQFALDSVVSNTNGRISGELDTRSLPSACHALSIEAAIAAFQSDPNQGLTADQVRQRQHQFGPNELKEAGIRPGWLIFLDQFKNPMLLMLLAVAVVSAMIDWQTDQFPKDAIAILAIVLLNGLLGYAQESRAEKALAALKQMSAPQVRVLRQGQTLDIPAREVVPGDILWLEAGMQIGADARLLEAIELQVQESALTGEAEPVAKQAAIVLPTDTPLGDRRNLVFRGTLVTQGKGKALVTAIGMETELGRIATLLQSVEAAATPLQERMAQLANTLVVGALLLVALVVSGGVIYGGWGQFAQLLEVSLSIAVAVVPESLPAVITVALAIGVRRLVQRQALIRKLPAVETLGSVTTICSDKTGTLTQNKMVVQTICTAHQTIHVTGEGYKPVGNFRLLNSAEEELTLTPGSFSQSLQLLLVASITCNDAILRPAPPPQDWEIVGDPTEAALLVLAAKAGFDHSQWQQWLPRSAEIPFSSERKRMSVVCENRIAPPAFTLPSFEPAACLVFSKGSPEIVLEACVSVQIDGEIQALTPEVKHTILNQNAQLAEQGLRVLGLAYKPLVQPPESGTLERVERSLIWLGMVGISDPPRPQVKAAVDRCRAAGIRPIMITGDHPVTAQVIAEELGIWREGDRVLTGSELDQLSPSELHNQVKLTSVYARVAPEHKLRIVQAWQQQRQVVAMTGDGVNDAPALKQANIGIAMGITGTDVSKEAADMVLLDDNFNTIVTAVEEGRTIYENIRRFIKYVLGSNIGEVLTIAAAPLIGLGGTPLSPLQILWMNLVTDGLPALALALEKSDPGVMHRPPHPPHEGIFARGVGTYIIRVGIVFGVLTILLMGWAYTHTHQPNYPRNPATWQTMVFTTLCIAQMGHALAVRTEDPLFQRVRHRQTQKGTQHGFFASNPYLWGAISLTTGLQLLLIYSPPLRNFFGTFWLSPFELSVCLGFSGLVFLWLELEKWLLHWLGGGRSLKHEL